MKHLNFLSKSSSRSYGHRVTTLASTVGSPSVDRRGAMLRLLSVLVLVLTIGVGQMWGTNFTLSSASSVTEDGITVSFAKSNGNTAPTWYDAGLRLYAGNTVTISCEDNITDITFNWEKQGKKDFASATASPGTYTHPSSAGTGTWSGEATSVTFTIGSSGQLQLNTLSVTVDAGTPSCTITPQSNNTSYGTVELSGSVITASPKTGYRVSTSNPYSVSPANSATVAQNGNAFTVTPSANTIVTINFEAIPTHKISFNTGGLVVIADATNIKEGDTYNITQTPAESLTDNCEYGTFVGWTTASSIADASVCPTTITSYQMGDADVTLHAVYSKTTGGSGAAVGTTMWADNFNGYEANATPLSPASTGTTIYNNASIEYEWVNGTGTSPGNTKVATQDANANAGGDGNEILIGKKGSGSNPTPQGGYLTIHGIPSGGATTLTLSYRKNNRTISNPSITETGYSISAPTGSNPYTCTITCGSATTFDLTFTATTTYNVRMDDFSVIVATTTNAGTTTYSLDATCCEPLGSINGSFFWTTHFCPVWPAKHRS